MPGVQFRKCPNIFVFGAVLVIVRTWTRQLDRCQGPLRVITAKCTGVDTERDELSEPYRRWRRRRDELHARSRRKREVSHRNRVAGLDAVLGVDRDTVNGDDLNLLWHSVEHVLEVQDGVGTGIRNAQELLLSRWHLQDGRNEVVGVRIGGRGNWDIVQGDVPRRDVTGWDWVSRHILIAD